MNKIILITSEGCLGCKVMKNSISSAINKTKVYIDVEELDISKADSTFIKNFNITDTPCTLLFKDDEFLFKKIGSVPTITVVKWIDIYYK